MRGFLALKTPNKVGNACQQGYPRIQLNDALIDSPSNAARTLLATEHVRFIADEAVAPGGAVVRSADCEVNAEVSDRVERIGDELTAGWRVRQRELGL